MRKQGTIFAAVEEHKQREKIYDRLNHKLDMAQGNATKKHGRRPSGLIAWRKYGAIGGEEIDKARKEFLAEGFSPKLINKEYREAKARERAGQVAGKAWDHRVGIAALIRECDRAMADAEHAAVKMSETKPTTPAGAAAMLCYVTANMKDGEVAWHEVAVATLIATLFKWGKNLP